MLATTAIPLSSEVNKKKCQEIDFAHWLKDKIVGRKGCKCSEPRKQAGYKLV